MTDTSSSYRKQQLTNSPSQIAASNQFQVQIVGVTFDNRQSVIANLKVGEEVFLRRDPTNAYDTNAICVENKRGQQIGFISRDLALRLAPAFDQSGKLVIGTVTLLVGGQPSGSARGVRIQFTAPDGVGKSQLPPLEELDL